MTYAAPLPYCQPARPFAVSPPDSLISVFVAPLPPTHPEFRPLDTSGIHPDYFSKRFLDERLLVQRSGSVDSYETVTRVIRDWFSDFDARYHPVGNPTILTRILSVVHAAASPDFLSGDYVFDHGVRAQPQLVPVPGGNLDTLLWLAWRYVHAFAVEGLRLSERLDAAPDGLAAATLIYDFITPAGAVPGHDLALAGNRRLSDPAIESGRASLAVASAFLT